MSPLRALVAMGVCGLVLSTSAAGALEVRVTISPKHPAALEATTVVVRAFAPLIREDGSCCRLEPHAPRSYPFRVESVSPTGKTSRIPVRWARGNEWRGTVRFSRPGRWQIRLPQFFTTFPVRVGSPEPTPSPAGFGPLGMTSCAPASPAGSVVGTRYVIFGSAVGDEILWALPSLPGGVSWARSDAAVFDGLVGKEMKIVFAMTSREPPFHAIGPDGRAHQPIWVRGHAGTTWVGIPGYQWGAGFVFTEPGCWRIRVGLRGDVWLLIRS